MELSGGEAIGRILKDYRISHVFTLSGGHISPILVGCKKNGIHVVDVRDEGNAVFAANTPNIDSYKNNYPWTLIKTSGEAVGLPEGFQGSSEVGHLNMGAGRVVLQELKRIDKGFKDGSIFQSLILYNRV